MTTNERTVGRYLRWLLAALAAGAGVIHFAVAGEHFDLSWWHGTFFAVVAWLQLSYAAAVVIKPTQRLLAAGAILNAAVIGTWTMSRVWGVPIGPGAWEPEPVSLADALSTGFEGAILIISVAVLVRPSLAMRSVRPAFAAPGLAVVAMAVAVVSTMSLTPSFASDHHHGEAAGHGDGHGVAGGDGHADAEGHTNAIVQADGTSACEQAGVANEGNSGHGHRGPVPFTEMDAATREVFQAQVAASNAVVAAYPTAADAEAAGYKRITPYVPCIAAHYLKASAFVNGFDPAQPEILLYEGTEPTSGIVGLSYLAFAEPDTPPEGFAGENDPWHIHARLCIGGGGGVRGDESTTKEECEARGGRLIPLENLWMMHMWNVPGWDSRWGLFSSEHPDLGGAIGNINGEPEPDE